VSTPGQYSYLFLTEGDRRAEEARRLDSFLKELSALTVKYRVEVTNAHVALIPKERALKC
jgi:hypothetical protein